MNTQGYQEQIRYEEWTHNGIKHHEPPVEVEKSTPRNLSDSGSSIYRHSFAKADEGLGTVTRFRDRLIQKPPLLQNISRVTDQEEMDAIERIFLTNAVGGEETTGTERSLGLGSRHEFEQCLPTSAQDDVGYDSIIFKESRLLDSIPETELPTTVGEVLSLDSTARLSSERKLRHWMSKTRSSMTPTPPSVRDSSSLSLPLLNASPSNSLLTFCGSTSSPSSSRSCASPLARTFHLPLPSVSYQAKTRLAQSARVSTSQIPSSATPSAINSTARTGRIPRRSFSRATRSDMSMGSPNTLPSQATVLKDTTPNSATISTSSSSSSPLSSDTAEAPAIRSLAVVNASELVSTKSIKTSDDPLSTTSVEPAPPSAPNLTEAKVVPTFPQSIEVSEPSTITSTLVLSLPTPDQPTTITRLTCPNDPVSLPKVFAQEITDAEARVNVIINTHAPVWLSSHPHPQSNSRRRPIQSLTSHISHPHRPSREQSHAYQSVYLVNPLLDRHLSSSQRYRAHDLNHPVSLENQTVDPRTRVGLNEYISASNGSNLYDTRSTWRGRGGPGISSFICGDCGPGRGDDVDRKARQAWESVQRRRRAERIATMLRKQETRAHSLNVEGRGRKKTEEVQDLALARAKAKVDAFALWAEGIE